MTTRAIEETGNWDDYWVPSPWGQGQAGAIDGYAPDRDVVQELRAVVEEITGKPVSQPKRRIGFLP
jgi:hypothetical protein